MEIKKVLKEWEKHEHTWEQFATEYIQKTLIAKRFTCTGCGEERLEKVRT